MRTIRRGVFETNSSSVHSLTMCTKEDYDKFVKGELVLDGWSDKLVKPEDAKYEDDIRTYDDYCDGCYETFEETYTTPSGEKIVAFGYYGYDC